MSSVFTKIVFLATVIHLKQARVLPDQSSQNCHCSTTLSDWIEIVHETNYSIVYLVNSMNECKPDDEICSSLENANAVYYKATVLRYVTSPTTSITDDKIFFAPKSCHLELANDDKAHYFYVAGYEHNNKLWTSRCETIPVSNSTMHGLIPDAEEKMRNRELEYLFL